MGTPTLILDSKKSVFLTKFLSLGKRVLPKGMSEKEAEAYRLGLKHGYGEGLKDGVDLGVDVGMDSITVESIETDSDIS